MNLRMKKGKVNTMGVYFTAKQVMSIMKEILGAVAALHNNGIMHRDIKMENVMFSQKDYTGFTKLIDFGSSVKFRKGNKLYDIVGSPCYVSPEMLGKSGYDHQTDVWSCGIIFHHLILKRFPFDADTDLEILHAIQNKPEIGFTSKTYTRIPSRQLDLLKKLLCPIPEYRITAYNAYNHDYFVTDGTEKVKIKQALRMFRKYPMYDSI